MQNYENYEFESYILVNHALVNSGRRLSRLLILRRNQLLTLQQFYFLQSGFAQAN